MANYAVAQFLDSSKKKKLKVVPIGLIRYTENGATLSPSCLQDVPSDSTEVKWQKSDVGSDGYFPAKILCLGGTVESTIAAAKGLGHKLPADCLLLEPVRTKLDTPESPKEKNDRKARASIKRDAAVPSEVPSRKKVKKASGKNRDKAKQSLTSPSKEKKKKAPVNKLAADPIVAARLKEALDSALSSNPFCINYLPKSEENDASLQDSCDAQDNVTNIPVNSDLSVKKDTANFSVKDDESSMKIPESELSPAKSLFKPSPVKAQFKPSPVKAQFKPSPVKSLFKPSPVKAQFKPSPVKSLFKPSPAKSLLKPSPVKSQLSLPLSNHPSPLKYQFLSPTKEGSEINLGTSPSQPEKSFLGNHSVSPFSPPEESPSPSKSECLRTQIKTEKVSSSNSSSEGEECNTTVKVSSESSISGDDSSEDSSESDDPVFKLTDDKKRLQQKLLSLKQENHNLKSQLSVVWGEQKKKADASQKAIEDLKGKLIRVQEELKQVKSRNCALQEALVNASSSRSVSRTLQFETSVESSKHSGNTDLSDEESSPDKKKVKGSSETEDSHEKKPKVTRDQKGDSSSKKQKPGKKYIENNALPIDGTCQKVLSYLNKTEMPIVDKKGNVDIGNNVSINYKSMMDILRSKTEPETMARNLTLLAWDTKQRAVRSLDGKGSNRYPNAPKKEAATPSKVNSILGAVKASLLKSGASDGSTMTTTLFSCRRGIGNRFNETATQTKKSST